MAQTERFMVGAIECEIVPDGVAMYQPADLFARVPEDQIVHLVVALASGNDAALYLGDAVLDEANFAHPDWVSVFEWDPAMAVATRTALIDQAIAENQLLIGPHLAARGYPERSGGQYRMRRVGAQVPAVD